MKKTLSLALTFVMVLSFLFSLPVSAFAAVGDKTASGQLSDTSREDGGVIYWSLKYNTAAGTASLNITGDGYMPNDLYDESWHSVLPNTCYLTSVTIGEGVKSIMNGAFAGESELKSVKLPDSLEIIGEGAFTGTGISNVTIPSNVKAVSVSQFESAAITNINVSSDNPYFNSVDGVVYSEDGKTLVAFPVARFADEGYSFTIPKTVTEIGEYAFSNCLMTSVEIPDSVTRICQFAFAGNINLVDVSMSSNVECIEDCAFFSCDSLDRIYLPNSLKRIEYNSVGCVYEIYIEDIYAVLDASSLSYDANDLDSMIIALYTLDYTIDQFIGCEIKDTFKFLAPKGSAGQSHASRVGAQYVPTPCEPIRIMGAISQYNGVKLSWTKSADADGYIIEKKFSGKWQEIYRTASRNETVYIDKSAEYTVNEYRVNAFNSQGIAVALDNTHNVTHHKHSVPVSAVSSIGGVTFNFTESDTAKRYYIYRKAEGEKSYTRLDCVYDELSYFDANVQNGVKYTYTVRSHDGEAFSSFDAAGVSCTYIESPKITVTNSLKGITVRWTKNSKATSYSIYKKTGSGKSVLLTTRSANETAFTDTAVKSGTGYKYYVKANIGELQSTCYTASSQNIKYLSTPSAKAVNATNGVKISWNKITGAAGYYVYRRTSGGSWLRIYAGNSASVLSFVDKTAKTGVVYEYTVRAFSGRYAGAFKNPAVSIRFVGTPKLTAIKSTRAGVTLSYSAVAGCDGYFIYRRLPGGSWTRLAVLKGATRVSYTDKTAVKGRTYVYTVRAVDSGVAGSFYSGSVIKDKY